MNYSRTLLLIVALAVLVSGCGSGADAVRGETPADPDTSTTTDSHVDSAPLPLPPPVGERQEKTLPDGTTRVWPNSAEVIDAADYRITVYTHCGMEPIDFDESFWEVESGPANPSDHLDDPVDEGEIFLVAEDEAVYTSSQGTDFRLRRIDGPVEREPCE